MAERHFRPFLGLHLAEPSAAAMKEPDRVNYPIEVPMKRVKFEHDFASASDLQQQECPILTNNLAPLY